jgi:hypothetical protein
VLSEISKQAVNLDVYIKVAYFPVPGFQECWTQKLPSLKCEYHTITNKLPKTASVVQQAYNVHSDIRNLAGYTSAEETDSPEWKCVVNSVKNGPNIYKALNGNPLFRSVYGMYTVTESRIGGEGVGRRKWCRKQNLIGINGPGRRLTVSKGAQEVYTLLTAKH